VARLAAEHPPPAASRRRRGREEQHRPWGHAARRADRWFRTAAADSRAAPSPEDAAAPPEDLRLGAGVLVALVADWIRAVDSVALPVERAAPEAGRDEPRADLAGAPALACAPARPDGHGPVERTQAPREAPAPRRRPNRARWRFSLRGSRKSPANRHPGRRSQQPCQRLPSRLRRSCGSRSVEESLDAGTRAIPDRLWQRRSARVLTDPDRLAQPFHDARALATLAAMLFDVAALRPAQIAIEVRRQAAEQFAAPHQVARGHKSPNSFRSVTRAR
jgi:hypothetical protein